MPSTGDAKHDAENRGPITIIVSSVLTTVGLLFLAARIASRRISARKLAVDDYLVVFSVVRAHPPFPRHPSPREQPSPATQGEPRRETTRR